MQDRADSHPPATAPIAGTSQGQAVTAEFAAATTVTFGAMILYDTFSDEQLRHVMADFDSANRCHWNFLPEAGRGAHGLALKRLSHEQLLLVHRLIASSLSIDAYGKVLSAFALEHMLREIDQPRLGYVATDFRDPGNYFLTFFGRPNPDATWGWRLVGHHVSLNFTIVGQDLLTSTPLMLGSEPGRIGPFRPLAAEEDLGFELLRALDGEQRARAIIHPISPPDFTTRVVPYLGAEHTPQLHGDARRDVLITEDDAAALRYVRDEPRGIAVADLSSDARASFDALLDQYVGRATQRMQEAEMARIRDAGIEKLHFAWAGATDYDAGHYYRIQGPVTLIEFNNTEGGANHVHTVWRDPTRDFAADLLPA